MSPRARRRLKLPIASPANWLLAWIIAVLFHGTLHAGLGDGPRSGVPPSTISLENGHRETLALGDLKSGETYTLLVSLESGRVSAEERVQVEFEGTQVDHLKKDLHAGDPDFFLVYRPDRDGTAQLVVARSEQPGAGPLSVRVAWSQPVVPQADRAAIEAEPNDSWKQANELQLGRDVYGTADDVDYLDNHQEGKSGLDWFRFEVTAEKPILVYFQLDLLDRDVSANLGVYTVDPQDRPARTVSGRQRPDGDRP